MYFVISIYPPHTLYAAFSASYTMSHSLMMMIFIVAQWGRGRNTSTVWTAPSVFALDYVDG